MSVAVLQQCYSLTGAAICGLNSSCQAIIYVVKSMTLKSVQFILVGRGIRSSEIRRRLKARRVRITPDSTTSITFIAPEVRCKASDELMLKCSRVGR